MQTLKLKEGSALVFSLIILSVLVTLALGVAAVSVVEKRSSLSTVKSTRALQVADSAIERFIQYSIDNGGSQGVPGTVAGFGTCSEPSGEAEIDVNVQGGGTAKLTFVHVNDSETADVPVLCNTSLTEVRTVKSSGEYAQSVRAVETAQATGQLVWTPVGAMNMAARFSSSGIKCAKDARTGIVYLKGTLAYTDPMGASTQLDGTDTYAKFFATTTLPSQCPGPAEDAIISVSNNSGQLYGVVKIFTDKSANVTIFNTDGSCCRGNSATSAESANVSLDSIYWSTNN